MVIAIDKANAAARMIRDASAGAVVAPGDSEAFLSVVRTMLGNPFLLTAQGRTARAYAEQTFGMHHVVPRFLDILARTNIRFVQAKQAEPERLMARAAAIHE